MAASFFRTGALVPILLAFAAWALTHTIASDPPASSNGIVTMQDVVFGKGGTHDLHADIAYPEKASAPTPAIICIHGGGWMGGSYKGKPLVPLANAGYFATSIEYRLDNVDRWPAQIEDCKLAVRWVRANAAKFNLDPNRIGVWGDSAGGHLSCCLGTMANEKKFEGDGGYPGVSSAVQAVVSFYGPTDFTRPGIYTPEAIQFTNGLFGVPREQNLELWKSGSPINYVRPGDPPFLLVHGDSDGLVPLAQSTVFADALEKAGVPHQLIVVKNGDHGFRPVPGTSIEPDGAAINQAVLDFFGKYLAATSAK